MSVIRYESLSRERVTSEYLSRDESSHEKMARIAVGTIWGILVVGALYLVAVDLYQGHP